YIAVLHIAQVDNDFLVFLVTPLGMLALKRMARGFTFGNVIGFVLTVALLLAYCNQQLAAYALLLFGLYTLYLFWLNRRVTLLWVPGLAVAFGILIATPRLAVVTAA